MNQAPTFSAIAQHYDATFTNTAIGQLQRAVVWAMLEKLVPEKPHVLEINCGTGTDAVWMAQRGWQVLATDVSPEMVQVAQEKLAQSGLGNNAKTQVAGFEDIKTLDAGPFNLIFSNFGGLNCISPQELAALWPVLWSKLNPGGKIIAVVMGRFCCWETLYFLLKTNTRQAFRRQQRRSVTARLNTETVVPTWYFSPKECLRGIPMPGKVDKIKPVGFWLPPSYLDPFFSKYPGLLHMLAFLEKKCTPRWTAWAADHYLLCVSKPNP